MEYIPLDWVNDIPMESYIKLNDWANSKKYPICLTVDQMLVLLDKKKKDYKDIPDNKLMKTIWKDVLKSLKK